MDSYSNAGRKHDPDMYLRVEVNLPAVRQRASVLTTRRAVKKDYQAAWLLRAVTCIDLTTLSGDDTFSNVHRLCSKAANPIRADILDGLGIEKGVVTTGAVCVYPARVADCVKAFGTLDLEKPIPIAAVATGFPTGQYGLSSRLDEIKYAVENGASEIDIVINRAAALTGDWETVYSEVCDMKKACGKAHLKTILATGELGTLQNVYRASMVCMMAGADFIKTSTGKEGVNAILPVGIVMARAIWDYYLDTGIKVGFKPAGGIRTAKDALSWQFLMKEELGDEWLQPDLFRIGASGLLGDIERQLFHHVTGRYAALSDMPPC
ncbi:deoxyribose-phosphate aldolase [Ixodes scapularis]|uniref:deoxyribose-phosphate aldolase n=1 Tax=Ixodes scapularis TaxID=6945 RepID=UPI001C38DCDD|nr:deoxyribose-phosphate aldolase [Ixodes scapularis]